MAKKAVAAQAVDAHNGTAGSSEAVRTCIGCRKAAGRLRLVRIVRSTNDSGETVALVDLRRRTPGRGAWLHPSEECWKLAIKRRAIGRALPGVTNVHDVEAFAQNGLPLLAGQAVRT
ncbi:YlxR family protein [Specibacter sp. AOP5-B1-6]|uniref:YlxR family protein n=1 Tax=Specibacter sp. AOP5-B1-6 TaxID=3457653 RepID=UPI003FB6617D